MRSYRVVFLAMMLMAALACGGQEATDRRRSETMEVTLRMEHRQYENGTAPMAYVYTDNLTKDAVYISLRGIRVHLTGPSGEPPRTEWYQRLLVDPGHAALETTLSAPPQLVAAGGTFRWGFPLNAYYGTLPPAKYTLSIELTDASGKWLETNTEEFVVVDAPRVDLKQGEISPHALGG
jgi:hypothetical protein